MPNEPKYKVVNGTSYYAETPDNIIAILEKCRQNRTRILIDLGDTVTGKSWGEIHDIRGYVGRSTGTHKIPLLVYNSRSMGGGSLLTHRLVKTVESKGGLVLYQHPNYQPANN